MSKSAGLDRSRINLTDSPDAIAAKLARAVTDANPGMCLLVSSKKNSNTFDTHVRAQRSRTIVRRDQALRICWGFVLVRVCCE
jgi:tryptophanyl-tRNA synthetase